MFFLCTGLASLDVIKVRGEVLGRLGGVTPTGKSFPGRAQAEIIPPGEGDVLVRGSSKQSPNTRLLTSKQLKADTRLAN